jgi:seryl-tRNA synthetase
MSLVQAVTQKEMSAAGRMVRLRFFAILREDVADGFRSRKMSDRMAIQAIEEQLTRDRQRLEELRKKEAALLEGIGDKGFRAATNRVNLLSEMKMLEDSVRKNENRLAKARE